MSSILIQVVGVLISGLGFLLYNNVTELKKTVETLTEKLEQSNLLEYRVSQLEDRINKK